MADDRDGDERWASNVVLGNGETVHIRPIRPSDAPALAEFHRRQSADSVYRRYFTPKPSLSDAELEHFTNVDFVDRAAFVVERYDELIAWASYERWPGRDDADAAFQVDDGHQGKGIATLLLEHLATVARSNGLVRFTAEVLADNRPMLAVFSRAGWPIERHFESGIIDLDFPLDETEEFLESVERREQRADSRAVARLLLPRSIAVVGASERPGTVGDALWRHVTEVATVPVYAVNPRRGVIGGRRSFPNVRAVPGDVWLAVIAVPAAELPAVIDDCIKARVRGAVIITSIEGTDIDIAGLVERSRRHGMRIIGPGSMGVAVARSTMGLQASLVSMDLRPGPVAVSLQSGSLGASVLRLAADLDLGLSWFVSLGDRCDVSANDLLQFWEDDETTRVIAMYTESFGNPRKFARIARRVSRRRPIVAVRTGAAAIGPSGGALYQQAGLIEVPTVTAMLETARVLATQPVMRGPRVALLANARSPATLARAALGAAGLEIVDVEHGLDWRSSQEQWGDAVRMALADADVDALMVVHAPPLPYAISAPVEALEEAANGNTKPVVIVLMGGRSGPLRPGSAIPAFGLPEPAAAVLGHVHAYGRWLHAEAGASVADLPDIDRAKVDGVVATAIERGATTLDVAEVVEVLEAYGIVVPASRLVAIESAVAAADSIGYPVAVKAARRHLGRSVEAGVALDLRDAEDVAHSVEVMQGVLGEDAATVVVQRMIPPGLDLRVRAVVDERVGPLVAVGLGGTMADLLADEKVRLAPLSEVAAGALVAGSRAGPALDGGGLAGDRIVDVTRRLAQLMADHPELTVADLNPVIVSPEQAWVTDAVIDVGPAPPAPGPLRRLT